MQVKHVGEDFGAQVAQLLREAHLQFLGALLWCQMSHTVWPAAKGLTVSMSTRISSNCSATGMSHCMSSGQLPSNGVMAAVPLHTMSVTHPLDIK
jgi:hypothetical protein